MSSVTCLIVNAVLFTLTANVLFKSKKTLPIARGNPVTGPLSAVKSIGLVFKVTSNLYPISAVVIASTADTSASPPDTTTSP